MRMQAQRHRFRQLRSSRKSRRPAYFEFLESRVLLTAFAPNDVAGLWNKLGTDSIGTVQFDDVGNVIGGSITDGDGNVSTPSGTYAITSTGVFALNAGGGTQPGAMSNTKDVVATSNTRAGDKSLTLAVRPRAAVFTNADLNGTWTVDFNGNDINDSGQADSNGFGTIAFDGAGAVTGGSFTTGAGSTAITGGSYTLNADSTVSMIIDSANGPFSIAGALNSSKDVLALDPLPGDFPGAVASAGTTLVTMVHSTGAYTNADAAGTWLFFGRSVSGFASLDASGHIVAGQITSSDGLFTLSGTYVVSAGGAIRLNISAGAGALHQTMTFGGAINASRNLFVMNSTSAENNLTISIKISNATDHLPTLTSIAPFSGAVDSQPFDITFDQLKAASNAADADGDTLQFKVTSLGGGAFSLNNTPVATVPFVLSSGDILTWTPDPGTRGSVPAFYVQAFDGIAGSARLPVVVKTSLDGPISFDPSQMDDSWDVAAATLAGGISFDAAGNIADGSLSDDTGAQIVPNGNYTFNADGTVVVASNAFSSSGAMNGTHDVIALANGGGEHALQVLVRHGPDNFSAGDLFGTWTVENAGDSPGANGGGTVMFDGVGAIIGGSLKSGSGAQTPSGKYSVDPDGTVHLQGDGNNGQGGDEFDGHLNASKDFLILSPADLPNAASNNDTRILVLVRSFGTYSNADATGTWTLATEGSTGFVTLDGAGHITGGQLTDPHGTSTLNGTYTVSATGAVTVNVKETLNNVSKSGTYTGAMNVSRNAMIVNRFGAGVSDTLGVLISSGNHPPTLSKVATLATAVDTQPFDISYDSLLAASNAADADGDAIQFQVTSLGVGGFQLNNAPAPAVPFFVGSGDTLTWTPPAATTGTISAFSIKAFDGTTTSALALPVKIKTALPPTVSIAANKNKASETNNGTTTGIGQYTISRMNGDLSEPLIVSFTFSGTATIPDDYALNDSGGVPLASTSITIPAGKPSATITLVPADDAIGEGPETAILALATDSTYIVNPVITKASATVNIIDNEPVVSITANRPTAPEANTSLTGQFTISRVGGDLTQPLTITLHWGGTATDATDFDTSGFVFSDSITIPANAKSATITIVAIDNLVHDSPSLNIILSLVSDTPYFVSPLKSQATVTITERP